MFRHTMPQGSHTTLTNILKKPNETQVLPKIPVIDIFAGPGGLGEGFSKYRNPYDAMCFNVKLSIEKEEFAHSTLRLRAFFRQFSIVPEDYYMFLRGEISEADLYQRHPIQANASESHAWKAELGVIDASEVDKRIRQALGSSEEWILIGGPPCQAYSVIGRSRYAKVWREQPSIRDEDKRHYLYREYLRILATHQPPVFVLENVKGLLTSVVSSGKIADKIFEDLRNPCLSIDGASKQRRKKGYRLFSLVQEPRGFDIFQHPKLSPEDYIVRCEKYGIPQARHRIIIIGIRDDIDEQPEILKEEPNNLSTEKIIGDLPKIRSGLSKQTDSTDAWVQAIKLIEDNKILEDPVTTDAVKKEILIQVSKLANKLTRGGEAIGSKTSPESEALKDWFYDAQLKGAFNHSSRGHIPADLRRYFYAACYAKVNGLSPSLEDFPKALLPDHNNVSDELANIPFADRFRVQVSGRPSTTVTCHISKDGHYYIHYDPTQCRSLTVREAARLQTFPDNYFFMGPRTAQYHQVGNAVPPLLAFKLAEKVYKLIQNITRNNNEID